MTTHENLKLLLVNWTHSRERKTIASELNPLTERKTIASELNQLTGTQNYC